MSTRQAIPVLADLLLPSPGLPPTVGLTTGKVTAVSTSPAGVTLTGIRGSTTPVPGVRYLASYTPTVGDFVMVLTAATDLLVLGKVAP